MAEAMYQLPRANPKRLWAGDAAWLLLLMLYVVWGAPAAPFHGDEATLIAMSADFHHRFVDGDVDRLRYRRTPADPMEQGLRLVNGTLAPNLIGVAWSLAYSYLEYVQPGSFVLDGKPIPPPISTDNTRSRVPISRGRCIAPKSFFLKM